MIVRGSTLLSWLLVVGVCGDRAALAAVAAKPAKTAAVATKPAPVASAAAAAAPPRHVDLAKVELGGVVYVPRALAAPTMPGGDKPPKGKLAALSAQLAKAKPAAKAKAAETLAMALWWLPAPEGDREGARKTLREAVGEGGVAPESIVHRLAVVEQTLGDSVRAEAAWTELATRFPTSKVASEARARASFNALGRGTGAVPPIVWDEKTPAETIYVAVWIALRDGRADEALRAMEAAALAWTDKAATPVIRAELTLLLAYAGAAPAHVAQVLGDAARREGTDVNLVLLAAADAFRDGGELDGALELVAAITAVDAALTVEVESRRAALRALLGEPTGAADAALAAWTAASSDGSAIGSPRKEALLTALLELAGELARTYFGTGDERYRAAARRLYAAVVAVPGRDEAAAVKRAAGALVLPSTGPGALTLDVAGRVTQARLGEVRVCYVRALQTERELRGTIVLDLALSDVGLVERAVVTGPESLAAVASCVSGRARGWRFPVPPGAGAARVTLPIALAPTL